MPRPPVEVADVIRAAGDAFFDGSRKWFTWLHLKVLTAILRCRTAALGGHVDACSGCGHQRILRKVRGNGVRREVAHVARCQPDRGPRLPRGVRVDEYRSEERRVGKECRSRWS